jgi:hypothetical protein
LKGKSRVKVDSESPRLNFTNHATIRVTRLGIKASGQLHCNHPVADGLHGLLG